MNTGERKLRSIGILLDNYNVNQMNFCLSYYTNIFLQQQYKTNVIVFVDHKVSRNILANCSIMNFAELSGFDGPVVATNLKTLNYMLQNCYANEKFFYCWELEWLHNPELYTENKKNMTIPNVNYIVRSNANQKLFEQTWGKSPDIVHDFNLSQLENVIWKNYPNCKS
jgi:hypothetical protein